MPHPTFRELDFTHDTELADLKSDLDTARTRLDSTLFEHLAMLAPVAVGGMGMFLKGASGGGLGLPLIVMIALPAAIIVVSVFLSALSLAVAPTGVVKAADRAGTPIRQSREDWVAAFRAGALRTNWHRGFEDNVHSHGFALAALTFLAAGAWAILDWID